VEGLENGDRVEQDARPGTRGCRHAPSAQPRGQGRGDGGPVTAREAGCHEQRMLRALHVRWPCRRSDDRHDRYAPVRVPALQRAWCLSGRRYPLARLRSCGRRPQEG
jgi:hypothetical protein